MIEVSTDQIAALYEDHIEIVRERHDRALAESGYDSVVIASGSLRPIFLDDMNYPFKVNAPFKVWLPVVDNPYCFIVYTPGEKPKLVYWQPVDYWHKPAATPHGFWTGEFDIRVVPTADAAREHFPRSGRVAFIGEEDGVEGADVNPKPLLDRLHWERSWKTEYEIECMRRANVRGARGHRAAEQAFREGLSEYEIHLAYLRAADHTEEEVPYGNIIALNENASVLHYYHHERQRFDDSRRFSFLIDAGASVNGYASDITRTYSAHKDEFQQLIDEMDAMQQSLVAMVEPGIDYISIHMEAHRKVAAILARFGFVRGLDAAAIVDKHISAAFLPHGVGHFLGLQVHDVAGFMTDRSGGYHAAPADHPFLRLTRKIEARMVFTIEPGLYFIEPLLSELAKSDNTKYIDWKKVDSFRKFGGIRMEDDIAVTPDGRENLTRNAFAKAG